MADPDAVRIRFPFHYYGRHGSAVRGEPNGKAREIRMRVIVQSVVRYCCACGRRLGPGQERYVPDYTGDTVTAICTCCEIAKVVG